MGSRFPSAWASNVGDAVAAFGFGAVHAVVHAHEYGVHVVFGLMRVAPMLMVTWLSRSRTLSRRHLKVSSASPGASMKPMNSSPAPSGPRNRPYRRFPQPYAPHGKDFIAPKVAAGIVDVFEVVHVEHEYERPFPEFPAQDGIEAFPVHEPVSCPWWQQVMNLS